jgi:hypothetical protein
MKRRTLVISARVATPISSQAAGLMNGAAA